MGISCTTSVKYCDEKRRNIVIPPDDDMVIQLIRHYTHAVRTRACTSCGCVGSSNGTSIHSFVVKSI